MDIQVILNLLGATFLLAVGIAFVTISILAFVEQEDSEHNKESLIFITLGASCLCLSFVTIGVNIYTIVHPIA